jgi:methylated-DNA-[protein]-cysteine S-methyltransferase
MSRNRLPAFTARVLSAVCRVPPGRLATYGDIARVAGRPRAARAVGNIMRTCVRPGVPCHRIVAAGGRLGGYGGNLELKRSLLRAEGVTVVGTKIRDAAGRRWPGARQAKGSAEAVGRRGRKAGTIDAAASGRGGRRVRRPPGRGSD